MEGSAVSTASVNSLSPSAFSSQIDSQILTATFADGDDDSSSVSLNFQDLYKGLSLTSKNIVDKINELLKAKVPDGVQSLNPDDVTPEATADKIVQGATAFFDVFAKQNPNLEGEELLNKFVETISGGIQTGYDDASSTLEALGAFEVDGVKSGIEETKKLIGEKLEAWKNYKREQMGLVSEVSSQVTEGILAQAGSSVVSAKISVVA